MKPLLILLAATAFGQFPPGGITVCWPNIHPAWADSCTGKPFPIQPMRSHRIEWLEPAETYNERVIFEMSLRILMLETKVAFLAAVMSGEIKPGGGK